jgi:hypothetical protein
MAMKKGKSYCDPEMMNNKKGSKSNKSQSKGGKKSKNSRGK